MTDENRGSRPPWGDGSPPWGDGPPPWSSGDGPRDWRAYRREMWRQRRQDWRGERQWRGGPWRRGPAPVFGCLFALIFALFVGWVIAATIVFVSNFSTLPAFVVAAVILLVILAAGRRLRRSAGTLDELVDATARVEGGDYSMRVEIPRRGLRSVRQLARGFNTMVERLERNEDQRRTLLNDVSHELRTPLSVIAGNLEAMIDGVHPADEAHLSAILEQAGVMERLIDDLRTVALSEAGTLPLHREPTDPDVLIEEVVRSFAGAGAGGGGGSSTAEVTVTADVPSDLPIVDVDPVRLREVLINLVGNAVRHSPVGGSVIVRGRVAGDLGSPSARLEIRVIDSGPGIDPDVLPHVFERFVKGADSTGSGLGLSIARYLVAAHGGSLEVEATGSAGTTFLVTLPIEPPDQP
jgi:two-component system, OmpR family, sensor histidine kinase BaeS